MTIIHSTEGKPSMATDPQGSHLSTAPALTAPLSSTRPTPVAPPTPAFGGRLFKQAVRLVRGARHYPIPCAALALIALGGVFWLAGQPRAADWALAAVIVIGAVPLTWETLRQVMRAEFGVDLIAILAIAGSLLLGQYLAGALVVLMLSGGEALEAFALRRARSSLTTLAERAPRHAHMWRDGQLVNVAADAIAIGQEVVVKPGELIPVDGAVVAGNSSVSEADLTGEPLPIRKEPGALVMSGSVNLDQVLTVRATRRSAESQYAQIVRLVDEAQRQKAPIHRLADRYGVWFTGVAVTLAIVAWALSGHPLAALAVLVVATPCPLILATPIAIMSGIDVAARQGIVVKSGATIEQLAETNTVVFDKTGTLTLGTPRVIGVVPTDISPPMSVVSDLDIASSDRLFQVVASAEQFSAHILARATVAEAQTRGVSLLPVPTFEETPGKGIHATVGLPHKGVEGIATVDVLVGNRTYMRAHSIELPANLLAERADRTAQGQIVSFIALDHQIAGLLIFADVPRPDLASLMPRLKAAGITEVLLLTGDGQSVAEQIGRLANVDRVVAQCLPAQKAQIVAELQAGGRHVLMVGDGVNDAPALAAADVGLAMGAHGLTAASTVADAVLLSNDLSRVPGVIRLGRQVVGVAVQGIWVGIGLSLLAMLAAAFGFIPPAAGAILQEGIDVLVILNALRAGRI